MLHLALFPISNCKLQFLSLLKIKPFAAVLQIVFSLGFTLGLVAQEELKGPILDLEEFITEAVSQEFSDSLLPTDRKVSSAYFDDMNLLDIPRAITVISPEILKQFQIRDFGDLNKIGAGTESYNFYGLAGAPVLRGWQGGIYFNGMLRAFQRNEMPTSFGALEAIEIVKGPAPAQFVPSHVGGYVNMLPKSPFYDRASGSLKIEMGHHNHYQIQIDQGGPFLAAGKPAAYRISFTGQNADSWYDDVSNDFVSLYTAIKSQLNDSTYIFAGAEYFRFNSNENVGWNRPTQNLIDSGEYVIGEPLSLVRPGNGGVADRNLLSSSSDFRALLIPAIIVESTSMPETQRLALKNLADPEVKAIIYEGLPEDVIQSTSGYLYTPDYFLSGGSVFTQNIAGSTALADPNDFADSEDLMMFFDIIHNFGESSSITNKLFIEDISTDKLSSYQYAFQMNQTVVDDRLAIKHEFETEKNNNILIKYGAQVRFTDAVQLQDFWAEPFARRDITRKGISPNTIFLSGGQVDPLTGINYWGGGFGAEGPGGHAAESELSQIGVFNSVLLDMGDNFSVITSVRYDTVDFSVSIPDQQTDVIGKTTKGNNDFFNYSINPSFKLTKEVSLYAAYQETTTFVPLQGGAILGEQNFGDSELIEGGLKVSAMNENFFASAALYEWKQSAFNDRANTSDPYESKGFEMEFTIALSERTTLIGSFGDRETRRTSRLGFRAMPLSLADPTGTDNAEIGFSLEGGSLLHQFTDAFGGFTPEGASPTYNLDLIVPGAPETTAKLFLATAWESGINLAIGSMYNSSYWHNYDRSLKIDTSLVINANVSYETEKWELRLGLENLTEEDYFLGSEPTFAANTLITKAPEDIQGRLTLIFKF